MLADEKLFATVESILKAQGVIERFEKENGEIIGRMMIVKGELPQELRSQIKLTDGDAVFIGTFDFYDSSVGIAINTKTMQVKSGLWVTKQTEDADAPSNEWCEFFVEVIAKYIDPNGNYGIPMYTFCSESADFTVVPTQQ